MSTRSLSDAFDAGILTNVRIPLCRSKEAGSRPAPG
jgi:hypothetical protein